VKQYTFLSLFCGLGGGALGFLKANARLFGRDARFRCVGGIDNDPGACADFEYLTKAPALCADLATMTPGRLREFAGDTAPDAAFDSSPCKSFSGLTDPELAASPEYVAMAELYVTSVELLLSTWDVPPQLVIKENVPRIMSKGAHLVDKVIELFEAAGYAVTISTHDCGELGGLAQHRRRALLVARLKSKVTSLLYQPTKRRVRACGEVLGELPLPETPSAGPMHRMPRVGWLTWVRLALIPAGGDHRDIAGALDKLQKRREFWGRHHVDGWNDPAITVAGDGSNGAYGVADPRVVLKRGEDARGFTNICAVTGWEDVAPCVATGTRPAGGAPSVADPRIIPQADNPAAHENKYRVTGWESAAHTVIGDTRPGSGGASVADPRVAPWYRGALGVVRWDDPTGVITGGGRPSKGRFAVADPRVVPGHSESRKNPDHHYYVLPWTQPSFTVHGKAHPGTGAYTVADPRVHEAGAPLDCEQYAGAYGVIPWTEAAKTISASGSIDNGPFAIADPRAPEVQPLAFISNPKRSPFILVEEPAKSARGKPKLRRIDVPVVILAEDGTWHRPMTPLELARLMDLPAEVDGAPLKLSGNNVGAWVERIGNAVPVGAARAIAEQMLITLLSSDVGAGLLPVGGSVWVTPQLEGAQVH